MRRRKTLPWKDPLAVFATLEDQPGARLLYGGEDATSVIVASPSRRLLVRDGQVRLDGQPRRENPFALWTDLMRARAVEPGTMASSSFATGALGLIGYEAAPFVDPALPTAPSPGPIATVDVGFYDAALTFDPSEHRITLFEKGDGDRDGQLRDACAVAEPQPRGRPAAPPVSVRSDASEAAYRRKVQTAVDRIVAGDFFQANVTRLLQARLEYWTPFDLFRAMIAVDPAPMSAFIAADGGWAASISPERFLRVVHDRDRLRVIAEPIKGTAPRHPAADADRAAAEALAQSEKDRAENIMIVDLMRNDLAPVCVDHSIEVTALCDLRPFSGVHHLVSRVEGILSSNVTAVDAVRALFPCGSVTGAPKVEAMRFIREMEGRGRGIYTGAIGYVDDAGAADFSVAIRTAEIARDGRAIHAMYGVGGGLTTLSEPEAEFRETADKASTFLRAIGGAVS